MTPGQLSRRIKELASQVGFDRCGIALAVRSTREAYVRGWLESGRAGTMSYLRRNLEKRVDARQLLPGARSVIVTASSYAAKPTQDRPAGWSEPTGRIAMYAWGEDYHKVVRQRNRELISAIRREVPQDFKTRACVDTAPLLEREYAAAAGLGWIGKNTMVLDRELGSYFVLGAIVTTLELEPDEPAENHCGSCRACLESCPTGAFPAAYEMDARRCISYLTIEHRGPIAPELAERMGDWLFGCDVCQSVCPFNREVPSGLDARLAPANARTRLPLREVLDWSEEAYIAATAGKATDRASLAMWRRNAAIAAENGSRPNGASGTVA